MRNLKLFFALTFFATSLSAHCDWINGPVVQSAREALTSGNVTPVLRWVKPSDEQEIRDAFARTMKVRTQSTDAKDLADRWFFELVVRVHRRGEGEAFEGLKGPDYKPEEGIRLADAALESGSVESVEKALVGDLSAGLQQRFAEAMAAKKNAGTSVEAGRLYVQKYVEYIHFAERLHQASTAAAHADAHAAEHDR